MTHTVTKQIGFCYGHRLMDYVGKCQHPHGHNGLAEITVKADRLDSRGMVVDFGDIKRAVKAWIDQNLDHRMLLRHDDPLLSVLQGMGEPVFVMADNPTAENIARAIYEQAAREGLAVAEVRLWETPDSHAVYSA
ncbi:MAG: 6-carboxytetrahydropterin synthase [Candidatus Sericytochromatia bacterium]|uniref:6-carboxy-5,6,7,8-tetrahydropterin synthase n=1 Tax=Candidatus Tanganyikabacteria bacterium TaxID=2961651 RepID=A0A937X5C1_9BACT|nr:6-carboxytetrahydropterin synthase [Candidatus Tanganyikabacteria bacterium]